MAHSVAPVRRLLTAGLTALLLAPLAGAVHHHGVDHSGAVLHIETDHGGHEHPPPDLVERQISHGHSPLMAPGPSWVLPEAPRTHALTGVTESVHRPARPPPPSLRSRAPPPSL